MEITKLTYRNTKTDEEISVLCPWADRSKVVVAPAFIAFAHEDGRPGKFTYVKSEVIKLL